MANDEDAYFNVDSRLLFQLGEKLVANRAVALAELVKNSYDADATKVTIRMYNIKSRRGTIQVEDNGSGINQQEFKQNWMRIATGNKENNPISRIYKRQKSGEKGIGRFACRRLAKRLIIKSVSETTHGKEELNATFDWDNFVPGSDVDKVPIKFFINKVKENTPTGTILVLEETCDSWDGKDIRRLRNELTELISPLTFNPKLEASEKPLEYDPGCYIELECSEFPTKEQTLNKTFYDNAWAEIKGYVDEKGTATYNIHVINKIISPIDRKYIRAENFKFLRNSNFKAYAFTYRADLFKNSDWKLNITRDTGSERGGIKVYADKFRVFGYGDKGDDWLRLTFDRARSAGGVAKEISFLNEQDSRPGLNLFRNNNLFGHVVFSRQDNPELQVTINRERLLENEAFEELRKFVRLGIDLATVLYSNEIFKEKQIAEGILKKQEVEEENRRIEAEEETKRAEEEAKKAEEEAKKAEEEAKKAEQEKKKAEEARRKIEKSRREAEEERRKIEHKVIVRPRGKPNENLKIIALKALEKEKSLIKLEEQATKIEEEKRKIAENESKKAESEKTIAKEIKKQKEEQKKKAEEELRKLEKEQLKRKEETLKKEFAQLRVLAASGTLVLTFGHELQALVQDMEEISFHFSQVIKELSEEKKESYNEILKRFTNRTEMITEFAQFFGLMAGKESRLKEGRWVICPIIKEVFSPFKSYFKEYGVDYDYEKTFPPYLKTPRMYKSELFSILHNLMTNAFKAVKGQSTRSIEVTGFMDENEAIHIRFLDSGRGLDVNLREEVFEPFSSFSEPDMKFGVGTGLGLKIVRDIVRSYGGDVKFIDAPEGWSTCVEVIFPEEDKNENGIH